MAKRFEGQTAIVTGGGRGIGRAVARLLGSEGANVVVCDLGGELKGGGADAGIAEVNTRCDQRQQPSARQHSHPR